MLGTMFGLSESEQSVFIRMNKELETVSKLGGYSDDYVAWFGKARAVIDRMIAKRESAPEPTDFIGGLVASRKSHDEPITDAEIAAQVFAISAASITSTGTQATMILCRWMTNRDQFERIRTEPELVDQAVAESMRMHHSLFLFPRFAARDTELAGTPIWKDMPVHLCAASADLDPEVFPDPLAFNIDRDPKHIMVFGAGPHFCAGAIPGKKIVATSLLAFMERHPNAELADPAGKLRLEGQLGVTSPSRMLVNLN